MSEDIWATLKIEGKREIPEKTCRAVASSITITTCKNPGATPSDNEFVSTMWEASSLTSTRQFHQGHCDNSRVQQIPEEKMRKRRNEQIVRSINLRVESMCMLHFPVSLSRVNLNLRMFQSRHCFRRDVLPYMNIQQLAPSLKTLLSTKLSTLHGLSTTCSISKEHCFQRNFLLYLDFQQLVPSLRRLLSTRRSTLHELSTICSVSKIIAFDEMFYAARTFPARAEECKRPAYIYWLTSTSAIRPCWESNPFRLVGALLGERQVDRPLHHYGCVAFKISVYVSYEQKDLPTRRQKILDTELDCMDDGAASVNEAANARSLNETLCLNPACSAGPKGMPQPRAQKDGAVSLIACHQGEPGSIPVRVTGFSRVEIVLDDAVGQRVFSEISRFPRPFIPSPLNTLLDHPEGDHGWTRDKHVNRRDECVYDAGPLVPGTTPKGTIARTDISRKLVQPRGSRTFGQCKSGCGNTYWSSKRPPVLRRVALPGVMGKTPVSKGSPDQRNMLCTSCATVCTVSRLASSVENRCTSELCCSLPCSIVNVLLPDFIYYQRRNAMVEETGDPREDLVASGIASHDSRVKKSVSNPVRNRTWFTLWEDSALVAAQPRPQMYKRHDYRPLAVNLFSANCVSFHLLTLLDALLDELTVLEPAIIEADSHRTALKSTNTKQLMNKLRYKWRRTYGVERANKSSGSLVTAGSSKIIHGATINTAMCEENIIHLPRLGRGGLRLAGDTTRTPAYWLSHTEDKRGTPKIFKHTEAAVKRDEKEEGRRKNDLRQETTPTHDKATGLFFLSFRSHVSSYCKRRKR
ncbi:hypothetical protein PR048_005239 [Dryococelus australis]|uniref:Uncharacterized protein n=1 Tax=Dryococelus australis TaxID=614101 RepID=A0ABQ9I9T0_9NEOP|nr:hypothetical protein PR048_005239 [Dryococelus australis]